MADDKKKPTLQFDLILDEPLLKGVVETAKAEVRWIIAKDATTPPEILKELAQDKDAGVKANVAGNENTPKVVLEDLAKSDEWVTRSNVAANPNAPPEALKRLATDPLWPVRRSVAANPKAEISLLEELAKDADEHPRLEAQKRLAKAEWKPIPEVMRVRARLAPAKLIKPNRGLAVDTDLYNKDIRGVRMPSYRRKWQRMASKAPIKLTKPKPKGKKAASPKRKKARKARKARPS